MMIHLTQLWNGEPAPKGHGGRAALTLDGNLLNLSWDLALSREPRTPESPAGFTDGLWEHDCLELFLASRRGEGRYLELEIGPAGHWLALAFSGVRERGAELHELDPELSQELRPGRWRGRCSLPAALAVKHAGPTPWKGLLAAVTGDSRPHVCWPRLPGREPDFHQPAAWAPLLPSPRVPGTPTGAPSQEPG